MKSYELGVCPVCNTSNFRQLADAEAVKREVEQLWEFHMRRVKPGAPIQQLFDRAIFSQAPPLHIVECIQCGTVMRNPRESAEALADVYEDEEPPAAAFDALFEQQRAFYEPRVDLLTRIVGNSGSVLEVGSYVGGFLAAASAAGWSARGIDVNATANEFARSQGCRVETSRLEEYKPDETFDVVAIWNCFDQLPDPGRVLQCARALLRPHGTVVIRVPNGAAYSLMRKHPILRGLLPHNNLLAFPYRHGFTPASLQQLMRVAGLKIVRVRGDALVSTVSEWTRPWVSATDGAIKGAMKLLLPRKYAPWIEVYVRLPEVTS